MSNAVKAVARHRAKDKTAEQCDLELGKLYENKNILWTSLNYIPDNTEEAKTSEHHPFVQI